MKNYCNLDGVIEFEATLADTPVTNRFDVENFYPAEGCGCRPMCGCAKCEGKSNAGGLIPTKKQFAAMRNARIKRKATNASTKNLQAQSSKIAATSLGKESQSDIELAKALAAPSKSSGGKKMSTPLIIGIVVGSLAILGTVTYLIIKRKKK